MVMFETEIFQNNEDIAPKIREILQTFVLATPETSGSLSASV